MFKRFGNNREDLKEYARRRAAEEKHIESWEDAPAFTNGVETFQVRADLRQCRIVLDAGALDLRFDDVAMIDTYANATDASETRRKGVFARAAVGGLLTGGTGAILGALTAGSTTTHYQKVSEVGAIVAFTRPDLPPMSFPTWIAGMLGPLDSRRDAYLLQTELAKAEDFANLIRAAFR